MIGQTPSELRRRVPLRDHLFLAVGLAIAVRPIIDLFGRYEGSGLNAGGALGLAVAALSTLALLLSVRRLRPAGLRASMGYAAIAAIGVANLVTGGDPGGTMVSLARFLVGYAPLLILIAVTYSDSKPAITEARFRLFLFILTAATAIPVAIAWLQFAGVVPFTYFDYLDGSNVGRPSGGYHQPNSLGRLLVFLVLFWMIARLQGIVGTRLLIGVFVLASATVLITTHRTSLISLVVVLLLASPTLLVGTRRPTRRLKSGIFVVTLFTSIWILGALANITLPSAIEQRLSTTVAVLGSVFSEGESDAGPVSLRGRGEIWHESWEMFATRAPSDKLLGLGAAPREAHNELLNALSVFGLVGIVSLIGIHIAAIQFSASSARRRLRWLIAATVAFYLLFGVTLQPLDYPYFMWLYFSALALAAWSPPIAVASSTSGLQLPATASEFISLELGE